MQIIEKMNGNHGSKCLWPHTKLKSRIINLSLLKNDHRNALACTYWPISIQKKIQLWEWSNQWSNLTFEDLVGSSTLHFVWVSMGDYSHTLQEWHCHDCNTEIKSRKFWVGIEIWIVYEV